MLVSCANMLGKYAIPIINIYFQYNIFKWIDIFKVDYPIKLWKKYIKRKSYLAFIHKQILVSMLDQFHWIWLIIFQIYFY